MLYNVEHNLHTGSADFSRKLLGRGSRIIQLSFSPRGGIENSCPRDAAEKKRGKKNATRRTWVRYQAKVELVRERNPFHRMPKRILERETGTAEGEETACQE